MGSEFNAKFWKQDFEEVGEEEEEDDDAAGLEEEDDSLQAHSDKPTSPTKKKRTRSPPVMGDYAYCCYFWLVLSAVAVLTVGALAIASTFTATRKQPDQVVPTKMYSTIPTSMPTLQPVAVFTLTPTKLPVGQTAKNSVYSIPDKYVEQWDKQLKLKLLVKRHGALANITNPLDTNLAFRQFVCDVAPNPPVKYEFPPRHYAKRQPLDKFLQHVQAMRHALLEYYHQPKYSSNKFYDTYSPSNEATRKRLGKFFAKRLRRETNNNRLVVAALGTSVLSGQDNCLETTYGPLLQRQLEHLMAPWQTKVQVRNLGQNGDGPTYQSQMLCGADIIGNDGEVDFVHLWYAMINPTDTSISRHGFVKRMLDKGAVNIHTLVTGKETAWCSPELLTEGVCTRLTTLLADNDWAPKHFWGRLDSGLCHNYTREGYVGTLLQNWHYGPMGFEIFTDQALMMYIDGLELGLQLLIENRSVKSPSIGEIDTKPHADCVALTGAQNTNWWTQYLCDNAKAVDIHCIGGLEPNWNEAFDMQFARKQDSAFPSVAGSQEWQYVRYKSPSTMRPNAKESADSPGYLENPNCTNFPDIGYVYASQLTKPGTNWLSFTFHASALPVTSRMFVYLCMGKRDQRTTAMSKLGKFAVQVGVNGRLWGRVDFDSPTEDCLLVTPNAIDTVRPKQDELGIQFLSLNQDDSKTVRNVNIGFVVLLGEQNHRKAVPTPTQSVIVTPETTIMPHARDEDGEGNDGNDSRGSDDRAPSPSNAEDDDDRAPSLPDDDNQPMRAPSPDRRQR
ncbi:hypothetical protein BASA81_009790 [Batrachochytrium salamandrivorans]|nr:hypothetical protein BASA81_009790 [Batrachochytrium salamandrivorans]